MALGLCCQYIEDYLSPTGLPRQRNAFGERVLQLGRWRRGEYTEDRVRQTYIGNVRSLADTFKRIVDLGYRCFRFSSNLLPLADKVPRAWWDNDAVRAELHRFGRIALDNGVRVTTHPGQFCVLSSDSENTVMNAITELSIHGWMMDAMGLERSPFYSINIHGGKRDRLDNLISGISSLPPEARLRLTLENCEYAYGVLELAEVSRSTGAPVCLDSHHHTFRTGGLELGDAIELATVTWRGVRPLQHLSNSEPDCLPARLRAHSQYVHHVPPEQLALLLEDKVDVEMEFKMKNIAIDRAIQEHGLTLAGAKKTAGVV